MREAALVEPRGEAHAEAERQALAERTGGGFERGDEAPVGMALIDGAELAQRVQLVDGRVAALGHDGVEHRSGVALGEDEAVAVGPLGIGGIVPHDVAIER